MIYIFIIFSLFILDYNIKSDIVKKYTPHTTHKILKNHITLRLSQNYGAIFNIGTDHSNTVKTLSAATLIITFFYFIISLINKSGIIITTGISLIISGGLSNTFDRFKRGYVIDYFSFNTNKFPRISQIVFNLGDIFIFIGILLTLLGNLSKKQ